MGFVRLYPYGPLGGDCSYPAVLTGVGDGGVQLTQTAGTELAAGESLGCLDLVLDLEFFVEDEHLDGLSLDAIKCHRLRRRGRIQDLHIGV